MILLAFDIFFFFKIKRLFSLILINLMIISTLGKCCDDVVILLKVHLSQVAVSWERRGLLSGIVYFFKFPLKLNFEDK